LGLFELDRSDLPVPTDVAALFSDVWAHIAGPGSAWTGAERVAIARAARAVRGHGQVGSELPIPVVDLIEVLVREPSAISQRTVDESVADIGLVAYLETIAVASLVTGIDTFTALIGLGITPLPEPVAGDPVPPGRVRNLKLRQAWVPTTGLPLPRLALSGLPPEQDMTNRFLDRLYMDPDQSREVGSIRGLSPLQLELVVTAVSHGNRCFYCTLGHLVILQVTASKVGDVVDPIAIVDLGIDPGIAGGKELVELSRSATSLHPDAGTAKAVASTLGPEAAVTAAEVAAAFMMTNRIVEATGQPALAKQRERVRPTLERLGALDFAHSGHTTALERPGTLQRVARRLRTGR
jgi:alkylhydroperoxidase family enzyme